MSIQVLYTARATATGGRNGHTQTDDGLVSVDLSIPKEMGGPMLTAECTVMDFGISLSCRDTNSHALPKHAA